MSRVFIVSIAIASLVSACGSGAGDAALGEGGSSGAGGAEVGPARSKSNVCPDLLLLSCTDPSDPGSPAAPPGAQPGSATCEVRFRDDDNTCAQSCDPRQCSPIPGGVACGPGPDPGLSTTITCDGARLDCTGDGILDAICTVDMQSLAIEIDVPHEPVECDVATDCELEGATCVAGFCDFAALIPTLNANFYVACDPDSQSEGRSRCAALTSDGDIDCDQVATVDVPCSE